MCWNFELQLLSNFHTYMAAILSTPGSFVAADSLNSCPFCHKACFKRLGNHLPRCPERNGQSYTQYLSKKTQQDKERARSGKSSVCPRCHRRFRRLDTHLRTSASCRLVNSPRMTFSTQCATSIGIDSYPSSSADPSLIEPVSPMTTPVSDPIQKPTLCLPKLGTDWAKANTFFEQSVVPRVLSELSVEAKYTTLVNGVYDYLADAHGTRRMKHRYGKRQRKLVNSLGSVINVLRACPGP